jgi:WD40 repeat protein
MTGAELAGLPMRLFPLRPLRRESLAAVIEGPCRLAGLGIDPRLVARLVDDTGTGDALPLLAYALEQLTEGLNRGGHISESRYDMIGGVAGALNRQADTALRAAMAATGRAANDVVAGLLMLVSMDEQGQPTRRRVLRAELPAPVLTELQEFVAHRLITADAEAGDVVFTVAHEAFLSQWPPLAMAIRADEAALRRGRDLEQAARQWTANGRPSSGLWAQGQLAAAVVDLSGRTRAIGRPDMDAEWVGLSASAREFLRSSMRRDNRRRRRATLVAAGLAVLFFFIAAGAGYFALIATDQRAAAEEQERIATARRLVARAANLQQTEPALALRLGLAADAIHPDDDSKRGLVSTLLSTRYAGSIQRNEQVYTVSYTSDGRSLAVGGVDGSLSLWDVSGERGLRQRGVSTNPMGGFTRVLVAPKDNLLATAGEDNDVVLWDIDDPARPQEVSRLSDAGRDQGYIDGLAFTQDGSRVATAGAVGTLTLWDLSIARRPTVVGTVIQDDAGPIRSLGFTQSGDRLVTGGGTGKVVIWGVAGDGLRRLGEFTQPAWQDQQLHISVAHDGTTVAVANESSVTLWNIADPAQPVQLGSELTVASGYLWEVEFSPDGRTLGVIGSDGRVYLFDVTTPSLPQSVGQPLVGHHGWISDLVFSPDSGHLATAGFDGSVLLWRLSERVSKGATLGTESVTQNAAFAPDGKTVITAGGDGAIRQWTVTDARTTTPLGSPIDEHELDVYQAEFSPDGKLLAGVSLDGTATLWQLDSRSQPKGKGVAFAETDVAIYSVAFSPDSAMLATGSKDGSVTVWDIERPDRPSEIETLDSGEYAAMGLAFSPDGSTLAAGNQDGSIRAFSVSQRPIEVRGQTLAGSDKQEIAAIAFSPDGSMLFSVGRGRTLDIWNVSDWTSPRLVDNVAGHVASINWVAVSDDGRMVATASSDGVLILWDTADVTAVRPIGAPIQAHRSSLNGADFAPDGEMLVTAGSDQTAVLWDLDEVASARQHPTDQACAIVGRGLDPAEWARLVPNLPFQETCVSS